MNDGMNVGTAALGCPLERSSIAFPDGQTALNRARKKPAALADGYPNLSANPNESPTP